MKSILILFDNIISLYIWILIINVIISWLVAFNVLNTSNRFVYSLLDVSYKLTAPPLNYIRRFLPNLKKVKFKSELLKKSMRLTVSNAGVRSVDKKGSFDNFLKSAKSRDLSLRLKKLKKSIIAKTA